METLPIKNQVSWLLKNKSVLPKDVAVQHVKTVLATSVHNKLQTLQLVTTNRGTLYVTVSKDYAEV